MVTNFIRSLSQRLTKSKNRQQQHHLPRKQQTAEIVGQQHCRHCQCRIQLLDQTDLNFVIEKSATGQELFARVFAHMDSIERDYFGLQYLDHFNVHHWLDSAKRVNKQIPIGPPYTLRLRVKFFPSEPTNIRDEHTRYLFFLQLRQDIQTGRLECPNEVAVEMAALVLQSEFGDFNPREHSTTLISEFRFYPDQDEKMEFAVFRHWASGQLRTLSPSHAEMAFLDKARQLPLYGVDLHHVLGRDGQQYRLGLSPQGILVLDGNQKIGLFLWEKIQRLDFRGGRLSLVVEEDLPVQKSSGKLVQLHTFLFHLNSSRAAKHLWKCAIEFHTFFRLKFPRHPQQQKRILPPLFRLGSTFRYRGRTEYETIHHTGQQFQTSVSNGEAGHAQRCSSTDQHFIRRPSQRYMPRKNRNDGMNNNGIGNVSQMNGIRHTAGLLNSTTLSIVPQVNPLINDEKKQHQRGQLNIHSGKPTLSTEF